jgi:hypothetical protein
MVAQERDKRYRSPYKLWVGYRSDRRKRNRDPFEPYPTKNHLGKRVTDDQNPWKGSFTALCDLKEKVWHGSYEGPITIKEMKGKLICRRCIQLAGLENRVPEEEPTVGAIKIDMTGASSGNDFDKPIPAGTYSLTLKEIGSKPSKAGNPMLTFTWVVQDETMYGPTTNADGELEDQEMKTAGRWLSVYYVLNPNALWKLKGDLIALGIEVPDGELELDTDELVGMSAEADVEVKPAWDNAIDEKTGKVRMVNEITAIRA